VQRIRTEAPLVHNITNYVVMNTTANALLALGASPVMAHALEEVEEMAGIAAALVINIGTLSPHWIESMARAMWKASQCGIPVVLDPVGAGATRLRTETVRVLIGKTPPTVIRGNASEIKALCNEEVKTKGVDSTHTSEDSLDAARALSDRYGSVVCVSGAVDLIVQGGAIIRIANGHPLMPRVTGLGCTATALIGAFAAVNPSRLQATAHAMAVMGIVGEIAVQGAQGPGTLQVRFIDALYGLKETDVQQRLKWNEG
jgi:hydroxyethylthiazole kinase